MADAFSPANLAKAVHATLDEATAAIPEGKHNAVLFDGTYSKADGAEFRALFVHRTDGGWTVMAEGDYTGPGGIAGKVATAKSW